MKEEMLNEINSLYGDIMMAQGDIVYGRLHHKPDVEQQGLAKMEILMNVTLQHLSYQMDHLKDVEFVQWIKVEDRLPEIGEYVLCATKGGKYMINSMYIPKDCYGEVLGPKEWHGSGNVVNSITHWMPIVLPKED